jgi:hypothetical protein
MNIQSVYPLSGQWTVGPVYCLAIMDNAATEHFSQVCGTEGFISLETGLPGDIIFVLLST